MLDLAPNHKSGFPIERPVLVADATAELLALCERSALGAVLAPQVGRHSRRQRRVLERPGGVLVEAGSAAFSLTGLRTLLREARGLPVIGLVHGAEPEGAVRALRQLQDEGCAAIAVDLPPNDGPGAAHLLDTLRARCEAPLLAQAPLGDALAYARLAHEAEADALIIAGPPLGLAWPEGAEQPFAVAVQGPLLFPLVLRALQQALPAFAGPIIARGGILTPADALACLDLGAAAVMLDSAAAVDPGLVARVARGLSA